MRYLFYDLEFATSKKGVSKICEFGYVVTNELFEVIKRGNFIIDPYLNRKDWDWRVVKKILTRTVKEYESNPTFDEYYDDIYSLLTDVDYVFGHSINGDAKALNQECLRYNLESINFDFYDVKLIYKEYSNTKDDTSVVKMLDKLGIKGEDKLHDAETDAYNTMLELKAMLTVLDASVEDIIELLPDIKDRNENYEVLSIKKNNERRLTSFDESDNTITCRINKKRYLQFLDNVKPNKELGNKFKDKKLSISLNYEENHFRQMLNLIQMIVNEGGSVVLKATTSDILVKYDLILEDGSIRNDSRYNYVVEANQNGSDIKIIDFYELLNILEITEDELDNMPIPSFDFLLNPDAIIKNKKDRELFASNKVMIDLNPNRLSCTLGDLFPDLLAN